MDSYARRDRAATNGWRCCWKEAAGVEAEVEKGFQQCSNSFCSSLCVKLEYLLILSTPGGTLIRLKAG